MSKELFRGYEYGDGQTATAVAFVLGFRGKVSEFDQTGRDLAAQGNNAVIYEYDDDILTAGDPEILKQGINDIGADFNTRTKDHQTVRYTGMSLGGGIAWCLHKDVSRPKEPALLAAAGANVPRLIFNNFLFKPVRLAFEANMIDEQALENAWKELHEPPTDEFVIFLGSLDWIVRRREMLPKIRAWQEQGIPVSGQTQWAYDHTRLQRWFGKSLPKLINKT